MSSVLFDQNHPNSYGTGPSYGSYGGPPQPEMQFFSGEGLSGSSSYYASRPSLEGNVGVGGSVGAGPYGGSMGGQIQGGFWSAFTPNGYADEPPLLEELGINFEHIKTKSLTVLNPFRSVDHDIMADADLAGPLLFCFFFGIFLLLSGKPQFGYIYGTGLLGVISVYFLLNLMSPSGIDAYRTASVLGYCLLPLVLISLASVAVSFDGVAGYLMSSLSILWCSYSASGIFVSVLQMSEQRLLVAYPVGLFYASFALLSVFDVRSGTLGAR